MWVLGCLGQSVGLHSEGKHPLCALHPHCGLPRLWEEALAAPVLSEGKQKLRGAESLAQVT